MSRNVAHNDLWKADSQMSTLYKVEFVVSSGGRLRAIDFNTGTVNGSYACVAGGRTTALPASLEPYFTPVSDGDVLNVLDAIFLVNRTLESYAAKNITAVQGVCSLLHMRPVGSTGASMGPMQLYVQLGTNVASV